MFNHLLHIIILLLSVTALNGQYLTTSHTEADHALEQGEYQLTLDLLAGKYDPEALALQSTCHFQLEKYELAEATLNHYFGVNDKRDLVYNEMISLKAKLENVKVEAQKKDKEQQSLATKLQKEVSGAIQGFLNQIKPVCESIISN